MHPKAYKYTRLVTRLYFFSFFSKSFSKLVVFIWEGVGELDRLFVLVVDLPAWLLVSIIFFSSLFLLFLLCLLVFRVEGNLFFRVCDRVGELELECVVVVVVVVVDKLRLHRLARGDTVISTENDSNGSNDGNDSKITVQIPKEWHCAKASQ